MRGGRDLRSQHNLGYWLGHDYLGLGVGAVSTIENRRWRNAPSLRGYLDALEAGEPAAARARGARRRRRARPSGVMLGLRLDEPLALAGLEHALDRASELAPARSGSGSRERRDGTLALTARGRFLGDGVTARAAGVAPAEAAFRARLAYHGRR